MKELETQLYQTFEDYRLSKEEKYEFRDLLQTYSEDPDTLSFVRNRAFDIVAEHMRGSASFDKASYRWLEHIVKLIDQVRSSASPRSPSEVYFSPGDECKSRIISLLDGARSNVEICVFTISDNDISHAILAAYERNIRVRVITDNDKANDRGSDVERLIESGVAVVKDQTPNHMHHKFALVDGSYVINGSFNWTRSASKYNNENIMVVSNSAVVARFAGKFDAMWREFGGKV
ncbi:MAG: phospholipase D-like domain-containing protein [Halioglobus sp.]